MMGALASGDGQLPFWMTANQYGLMPQYSGGLAMVSARSQFDPSKEFQYRFGASVAGNYSSGLGAASSNSRPVVSGQSLVSGQTADFQAMVDELYGSVRWKVLTLDAGIKHRENDFTGADASLGSLSVTGGHIIESGNSRSLPGYLVTLDPVGVPFTGQRLQLYGAYGDYWTIDQRYVKGALVHRMRAGLAWHITPKFRFDLSLDHYALWGGDSPEYGKMKVNLDNYLRVITGRPAGDDGTRSDKLNVIGDHGGGECFRFTFEETAWSAVFQHDIPYSDGSGMGFQNFPDGVNTLSFSLKDKEHWISDIVLEHQYTRYQSGSTHHETFDEEGHSTTPKGVSTTGGDNYFNNGEYCSGWTFWGRCAGDPLFFAKGTRAGTWSPAGCLGVENNRLRAYHIGLGGKLFRRQPYRLMLTLSQNYGTYAAPYEGESQWQKPWGTVRETGVWQFSGAFTGRIEMRLRRGAADGGGCGAGRGSVRGVASGLAPGDGLTAGGRGAAGAGRDGADGGGLTAGGRGAASAGRDGADGGRGRFGSASFSTVFIYGLYYDRGGILPDNFGVMAGLAFELRP